MRECVFPDRNTSSLRFSVKRNNADRASKDAWNHALSGIGQYDSTLRYFGGPRRRSSNPVNGASKLSVYRFI